MRSALWDQVFFRPVLFSSLGKAGWGRTAAWLLDVSFAEPLDVSFANCPWKGRRGSEWICKDVDPPPLLGERTNGLYIKIQCTVLAILQRAGWVWSGSYPQLHRNAILEMPVFCISKGLGSYNGCPLSAKRCSNYQHSLCGGQSHEGLESLSDPHYCQGCHPFLWNGDLAALAKLCAQGAFAAPHSQPCLCKLVVAPPLDLEWQFSFLHSSWSWTWIHFVTRTLQWQGT